MFGTGSAQTGWEPRQGEVVVLRRSGARVRVMDVVGATVFVRPLRGGRETEVRVSDLLPPDRAPGGFEEWQAGRG
ncbi:hypothetical protein ACIRBX_01495 [Kitasatospora sp. NPDC096147]|uniref:hypothetical protein n=1 Tax=Kitasatospora sp. NPDC096147 TaxID=3364093 RepID=UPI0037F6B207